MLNGSVYEMTFGKKRIKLDAPPYLGFEILCKAKIRQLEMVYDFLYRFMDSSLYNILGSDTDSVILEWARQTVDDCVKPALKSEYDRLLYGSCNNGGKPDKDAFLIRRCCDPCKMFDARFCGTYKTESDNNVIFIGLSAKCYVLRDNDDKVRVRAKGVQRITQQISDPVEAFAQVLTNQSSARCTNTGFREMNGIIRSYELRKQSLSNFYCKRQVYGSQGIYTRSIQVTLNPFKQTYICLTLDSPVLSPVCTDTKWSFTMDDSNGYKFDSVMHALCVFKTYRTSIDTSFESVQQQLDKITKCQDEHELIKCYNSIPSSSQWEQELADLIMSVIKRRIEQNPELRSIVTKNMSLPFIFATQYSQDLGCGSSPRVVKFHPPAVNVGRNLVGQAYDQLRDNITRKK